QGRAPLRRRSPPARGGRQRAPRRRRGPRLGEPRRQAGPGALGHSGLTPMADSADRIRVDFRTEPSQYRHWKLAFDGPVATLAIEEATGESRQFYLCAVNGACAGGGYELALATDWIVMADDGNTAVSLPEVPLLAVLPGTGGLTRLVDKRRVRRDRADFFCTVE